jgi:hypothetical protein
LPTLDAAQARWWRFNGHEYVADVLAGQTFKDGIRVTDDQITTTDEIAADRPDDVCVEFRLFSGRPIERSWVRTDATDPDIGGYAGMLLEQPYKDGRLAGGARVR